MFVFKVFEVLKIKEFTCVNDCLLNKSNAEVGLYGQTLFKVKHADSLVLVKTLDKLC